MGELIVNKVTYNSIFVTWRNLKCYTNSGVLNSPPFALETVEGPIPFRLSISCAEKAIVQVHTNVSGVGRGIISFGITKDAATITMKMRLNKNWVQTCSFDDILTLSATAWTNLKIDCKITWLGFEKIISHQGHPLSLLSVGNSLFDNAVIPDFTIIVEGQEIPSHKAILARYSPVLLAMFETPMKESKENKMTIEDSEYSTIKTLLDIIYTGKTEELLEADVALKVFRAAAKYQMSAIKILCEYALLTKIQSDNVLMLLAEADKYDAMLLCETCVAYIFVVNDDEITKEFKKIPQKPNIAFAIKNAFMDQLFSIPS